MAKSNKRNVTSAVAITLEISPKEANLTEWERNPEPHVFVDWHLALGVEC